MSDEKTIQKTEIMPLDVNPEALIAKAIAKGNDIPIDTMEKLLAMRRELKAEWSKEEYFKALANFQQACPEIKKTKIVYNKNSTTVRYRYAPLEDIVEQCKDLLKENGFSYNIKTMQQESFMTAICVTHHIAGHSEESALEIPIDHDAYMNIAQQVASALTYAKRYAFNNAFGIMTGDEDDDAQSTVDEKNEDPEPIKKANKKNKIPKTWQPVLEDIRLLLEQAQFENEDKKKAHAEVAKCKSLADLNVVHASWKKESEKRIAEQETLDESAGKVFDDEKLNLLLPIEEEAK